LSNNSLIAAFTVTLPPTPADGARYSVSTRGGITALTVLANTGQTLLVAGPFALGAGGSYAVRFKASDGTWWPTT
jgi:hypothetical protein